MEDASAENARLAARNFVIPSSLGDAQSCASTEKSNWHCVNTHSGKENLARNCIISVGFSEIFFPTIDVKYKNRSRLVRKMLFPGYFFVRFDADLAPWRRIRSALGVKMLFITESWKPIPIANDVIEHIRRLSYPTRLEIYNKQLVDADHIPNGMRVRVISGHFKNREGISLWSDARRIDLLLAMMGGDIQVQLALEDVEIVE